MGKTFQETSDKLATRHCMLPNSLLMKLKGQFNITSRVTAATLYPFKNMYTQWRLVKPKKLFVQLVRKAKCLKQLKAKQLVIRLFLLSIFIVTIISSTFVKFYMYHHNHFTHTFTYATCSNLIQSPFFRNSNGCFSSANRVVHC